MTVALKFVKSQNWMYLKLKGLVEKKNARTIIVFKLSKIVHIFGINLFCMLIARLYLFLTCMNNSKIKLPNILS